MLRLTLLLLTILPLLLVPSTSVAAEDSAVVTELGEGVYSFYSSYYTSLIVIGDTGVLVTDPANTHRAEELKKAIARLTDLHVTYIFLSHEHYDHVGGTEVFAKAKIVVQEKAVPIFALDALGVAPQFVHETFERSYVLYMGETKVEFLHFGGTSDGVANSIVHLPEQRVVYSADLYEDNELVAREHIDAFNSLGARQLLNTIASLRPVHAVAAHSIGTKPDALYKAADFFNDLYGVVLPKLKEARSGGYPALTALSEDFPSTVRLEKYQGMKNYEDLDRHTQRMIASLLHGG